MVISLSLVPRRRQGEGNEASVCLYNFRKVHDKNGHATNDAMETTVTWNAQLSNLPSEGVMEALVNPSCDTVTQFSGDPQWIK